MNLQKKNIETGRYRKKPLVVDATVEAATNHDRGYLTGLLAGWNLCMEGDVAGFDSAVKTTRALIADARAEQSEPCKACSDAGVCYVCGKALASQPAQPQAEVEVEAERLKQAIINIEGARAVARADFERHPDRKTVVHCWLQDIDVVLEALSTTPQAEAQAGETRGIKPNWKAMYESQLHATLEQADECDRLRNQLRAANDREKLKDQAIDRLIATEEELRAQLAAQPQAVEEAAKVDTYALQLLEAAKCPDCAGCVVMVEPGVFEQNECEWCFRRWQALEPLRALRNKADAQEENDG